MFTNQTIGKFNLCILNIIRLCLFCYISGQITLMAFSLAVLIFHADLNYSGEHRYNKQRDDWKGRKQEISISICPHTIKFS